MCSAMTVYEDMDVQGEVNLFEDIGLVKVGHHLAIRSEGGHLHFLAHNEFESGLSSSPAQIVYSYDYTERLIAQPDNTGTWAGTSIGFAFPSIGHVLSENAYYQTGTTAATEPVRIQIWEGSDDTGTLKFDQTYPASEFPASTEVKVFCKGYIEYDPDITYFLRYSSDANFSLKTDTTGAVPWFAADVSHLRHDDLASGGDVHWDRTGTTLSPKNAGDGVLIENVGAIDLTVKSTASGSNYAKIAVESASSSSIVIDGVDDSKLTFKRGGHTFYTGQGWNLSYPDIALDYTIKRSSNVFPDFGVDKDDGHVYTGGDLDIGGSLYQKMYSGKEFGLVADFPFTAYGSAQQQHDRAFGDVTTTVAGTPLTGSEYGKFGSGALLAAGQGWSYVPPSNYPSGKELRTFEVWVKPSSVASGRKAVFAYGAFEIWEAFGFGLNGDQAQLFFYGINQNSGTTDFVVGEWHLVQVTFDGVRTARMYVNGVEKVSHQSLTNLDTGLDFATLGGYGAAGSENFQGNISQFKIYNRVLSESELRTSYLRTGGDAVMEVGDTSFRVNPTGAVLKGNLTMPEQGVMGYWTRGNYEILPTDENDKLVIGSVQSPLFGDLIFSTKTATSRIRLDSDASCLKDLVVVEKLGVGLAYQDEPSAPLDVNGAAIISGDLSVDSIVSNDFHIYDGSTYRLSLASDTTSIMGHWGRYCFIADDNKTQILDNNSSNIGRVELRSNIMEYYDGHRNRIVANPTESQLVSPDGTNIVEVNDTDTEITGALKLTNLPTTDPVDAGAIWNDNGTLKISAGS